MKNGIAGNSARNKNTRERRTAQMGEKSRIIRKKAAVVMSVVLVAATSGFPWTAMKTYASSCQNYEVDEENKIITDLFTGDETDRFIKFLEPKDENGTVVIDGYTIVDNRDKSLNHMLGNEQSSVAFRNCTFVTNHPNRGLFWVEGGSVEFTNCKLDNLTYGFDDDAWDVIATSSSWWYRSQTVKLINTSITNNTVGKEKNIFNASNGNLYIGGSTKITGNVDSEGNPANLKLGSGMYLQVDPDNPLTDGACISVWTENTPSAGYDVIIAKGMTDYAYKSAGYFTSDNPYDAGIIYCDGEKDYGAEGTEATSTGHTHEAGTIWLTQSHAQPEEPVVAVQPQDQTVKPGDTVTFTAQPEELSYDGILSYQWYTNSGNDTFTKIDGATELTYTIENISELLNGYQYNCVITNTRNGMEKSATTDTVQLTISHTEIVEDTGYAATCTEDGKTTGSHCVVCNETIIAQELIPATGHNFAGEWIVRIEATATADGEEYRECLNGCGEVETRIIQATGIDDNTADSSTDGKFKTDVVVEKGVPVKSMTLATEDDDVLTKSGILTDDDRAELKSGKDVKVYLEVSPLSESTLSIADTTAIENAAKQVLGETVQTNYMDVSLFKKVGDNAPEKVRECATELEVVVEIPDELVNKDSTVTRTYKVIRLHEGDGAASVLDGTFDEEKNTFTFKTDRFSTYVLAYADTVKTDVIPDPAADDDDENETETVAIIEKPVVETSQQIVTGEKLTGMVEANPAMETKTATSPQTGDRPDIRLFLTIMLTSGIALLGAYVAHDRKKRDNSR
jgi:plastocyanin